MRHFPSQVVSYRRVEERSNALVRLLACLKSGCWSDSGQRPSFVIFSRAHDSQGTMPRHFCQKIYPSGIDGTAVVIINAGFIPP